MLWQEDVHRQGLVHSRQAGYSTEPAPSHQADAFQVTGSREQLHLHNYISGCMA